VYVVGNNNDDQINELQVPTKVDPLSQGLRFSTIAVASLLFLYLVTVTYTIYADHHYIQTAIQPEEEEVMDFALQYRQMYGHSVSALVLDTVSASEKKIFFLTK
jgi:hypothetical protein